MLVSFDIEKVESLADGAPFGAVGAYERVLAKATGEVDPRHLGNSRILYEVNNRGRKMLFGNIADGPQGVNDPKTMADVGNGFPMRQGYTIVWSGWDPDAPRANMGLGLTAPVATDNGKPIVKAIREEFVSGTRVGNLEAFKLSYEANTLAHRQACPRLLQRVGLVGELEGLEVADA